MAHGGGRSGIRENSEAQPLPLNCHQFSYAA